MFDDVLSIIASILGAKPGGALVGADKSRIDKSLFRQDGSAKGPGFLGPIVNERGDTATEVSIGVPIGGKEVEIPTLVPTLTEKELQMAATGAVTPAIARKAGLHAEDRIDQGEPPFAAGVYLPGRFTPGLPKTKPPPLKPLSEAETLQLLNQLRRADDQRKMQLQNAKVLDVRPMSPEMVDRERAEAERQGRTFYEPYTARNIPKGTLIP